MLNTKQSWNEWLDGLEVQARGERETARHADRVWASLLYDSTGDVLQLTAALREALELLAWCHVRIALCDSYDIEQFLERKVQK